MNIRIGFSLLGFLFVLSLVVSCRSGDRATQETRLAKTSPNEFVFNNGAEPESLDPHRIMAHDAAQHAINMFEGLLSRENDYFTIIPGLASDWAVSEDGLTYTFKLRQGVKWSNGDDLKIQHVRDSFFRAMNPEVANPYVYWYTDYIVGAKSYVEKISGAKSQGEKSALENGVGIRITGPDSLEIKLIKPVPYFKYFLSQPPFFVVHPSMFDPDAPAWKDPKSFVVNGAYKLEEWKVNQRIVMVRNPNYYDAQTTTIERIVAYPIADQSVTYNMYMSGELDWTGENTISPTLVASLKSRKDFHIMPILGTYMFVFNVTRKPFTDVRVRKALALAVEPDHITDKILRGGFVPTNKLVPPTIPAYKSKIPPLNPNIEERLAEAKKLLEEAGYKDGKGFPLVTIRYNTNESHHKIAQAIQQMWRTRLGIDVKLENMEWKVYLKEQQEGNFDISRFAWLGDYPDPTTFLEIFMTGNDNNRSRWSNKEFDSLVINASTLKDEAKRLEMMADAEKMVYEDYPFFGIYHYTYYSLMRDSIENWEPNMFGHYLIKYLRKK